MRNASECCQISMNGYHGHRNNQYQHRVERLAISENSTAQSTKAGHAGGCAGITLDFLHGFLGFLLVLGFDRQFNPRSGEKVMVEEKRVPPFKPGKELRQRVDVAANQN